MTKGGNRPVPVLLDEQSKVSREVHAAVAAAAPPTEAGEQEALIGRFGFWYIYLFLAGVLEVRFLSI